MDAAAACCLLPSSFFGVRLELREEREGQCGSFEGVAGNVAVLHMRQDLHVLHATDNSIKCRYFNSPLSLSPSTALPLPLPHVTLLSDVTRRMLHAAAHVAC